MKMSVIFFFIAFIYGCSRENKTGREIIKVDSNWLDSIKQKSDTGWVKRYRNNEFVTAEYFIDKKDSIVTQLMKDSAGTIRQISIAKYDKVRLFFAEYYANGQMKARLPVDSIGRYNGQGKYYYESGQIKSSGIFNHGFYYGKWENYDEKGKLLSTDEYDSSGQLIKSIPVN